MRKRTLALTLIRPSKLMNFDKIKNLNFKKKFTYLGLIFIAACLLIIYTTLNPSIDAIKIKRTEIVTQKIEMEQKLNKEKNMSNLSAKVRKIEPQADRLASVYINQNRELEFITTLEGIASANNVAQSLNLDLDKSNTSSGYNTVPLEINISGSYNNLLAYLISLETMNYYINVTNWQFSSSGNKISGSSMLDSDNQISPQLSESYNLRLTANTYWK